MNDVVSIASVWDRLRGRQVTATCRVNDNEFIADMFGPYNYRVIITDRNGVTGTYKHPELAVAKYHAECDLARNRRTLKDRSLFPECAARMIGGDDE